MNLLSENVLGRESRVNARCLDGEYKSTTVLDKVGSVHTQNFGLVGLGNIRKHDIDLHYKVTVKRREIGETIP